MSESTKIESLSEYEKDMMVVYREKSMEIGLRSGPTNRNKVVPLIKYVYERAKIDIKPRVIFFVKSPFAAKRFINVLQENAHTLLKEYVEDILKCDVDNYDWTNQPPLYSDGEANDNFVNRVLEITPKKMNNFTTALEGNHNTAWIQHYKYWVDLFSDRIQFNRDAVECLNKVEEFSQNAGWLYTFRYVAVVVDRPTVKMENGVIHNESGPAVRFDDGNEIYAIHGHVVPQFVVTNPEKITTDIIVEWTGLNAEVARIMIDIYGPSKYFMEMGGKVIDSDQLNLEGSSMRMLIEDKMGTRWLIGSDGSTGRVYHMAASATANSCSEAHSEMAGFDEGGCKFEC